MKLLKLNDWGCLSLPYNHKSLMFIEQVFTDRYKKGKLLLIVKDGWLYIRPVKLLPKKVENRGRLAKKVCRSDGEIYDSVAEAARMNDTTTLNIYAAIGKEHKTKGYKWAYLK